MKTTRFNLLLLEEGELYFEDYACRLSMPPNGDRKLSGRLKVASKNLVCSLDIARVLVC